MYVYSPRVLVAASAIFWKTSKYAAMAWIVALKQGQKHQNTELGSKLHAPTPLTQAAAAKLGTAVSQYAQPSTGTSSANTAFPLTRSVIWFSTISSPLSHYIILHQTASVV
jgi:hypothetical protein